MNSVQQLRLDIAGHVSLINNYISPIYPSQLGPVRLQRLMGTSWIVHAHAAAVGALLLEPCATYLERRDERIELEQLEVPIAHKLELGLPNQAPAGPTQMGIRSGVRARARDTLSPALGAALVMVHNNVHARPVLKLALPIGQRRQRRNNEEGPPHMLVASQVLEHADRLDRFSCARVSGETDSHAHTSHGSTHQAPFRQRAYSCACGTS